MGGKSWHAIKEFFNLICHIQVPSNKQGFRVQFYEGGLIIYMHTLAHPLRLGFLHVLCWVGAMFSLELLAGIPGLLSLPEVCRVGSFAAGLLQLDVAG